MPGCAKSRHGLTDDQRRRLAAKGMALGRRLLSRVATLVTPDTILRWHRRLIAAKCDLPPGNRSTPNVSLPGPGRAGQGNMRRRRRRRHTPGQILEKHRDMEAL